MQAAFFVEPFPEQAPTKCPAEANWRLLLFLLLFVLVSILVLLPLLVLVLLPLLILLLLLFSLLFLGFLLLLVVLLLADATIDSKVQYNPGGGANPHSHPSPGLSSIGLMRAWLIDKTPNSDVLLQIKQGRFSNLCLVPLEVSLLFIKQ